MAEDRAIARLASLWRQGMRWQAYDREVSDTQEYLEDKHHGGCAIRCVLTPYRKEDRCKDVANGKPGCRCHEKETTPVTVDRLVERGQSHLKRYRQQREAYP